MKQSLYRQRGVAAVELGLLLIPLVTLLFGITEFGRAFYQYNTIAKATRDGARYLSAQGPGDAGQIGIAKCLVVYGNQDCSGSTLVPGLTTSQVSVCDATICPTTNILLTGSGSINIVTVRVTGYAFSSAVPFIVPNITFNDVSTTLRQI